METSLPCPPPIRDCRSPLRARAWKRRARERTGARPPRPPASSARSPRTPSSRRRCSRTPRSPPGRSRASSARLPSGPHRRRSPRPWCAWATLGLPRDWSPARGLDTPPDARRCARCCSRWSATRASCWRGSPSSSWRCGTRAQLSAAERARRALETRAVYAPLANRLGVWQLKWELEDLAFRYLEPDEYRRIAAALNERRADRERYIEELCARSCARSCSEAGDRRRGLRPAEAHLQHLPQDAAQAARRSSRCSTCARCASWSDSIADCYAALGVVHGLWPYIPGEFDDYIATPKGNGYRSIHTAVIGPAGTQRRGADPHPRDARARRARRRRPLDATRKAARAMRSYERKIEWVRALLEPATPARADADRDLLERHARRAVRGPRLRAHPQGRRHRAAARGDAARLRLPRAHLPRPPLPRREGQRAHRAARPPRWRTARSSRSSPPSRKPRAATGSPRAGLPRLRAQPRQGARLVPQAGRRATTAAPAARSPSASSRAWGCAPRARSPRSRRNSGRATRAPVRRARRRRPHRDAAAAGGGAACSGAQPRTPARARAPRAASAGAARRWRSRASATCRHTRALLRAGAARADRRLRDARARRHDPPQRLREPRAHERAQARPRAAGRLGATTRGPAAGGVPGAAPSTGAGWCATSATCWPIERLSIEAARPRAPTTTPDWRTSRSPWRCATSAQLARVLRRIAASPT